jgi:2-phosphosulfolactate phosphatase
VSGALRIDVVLTAEDVAANHVAGTTVLVIDVLRASTTIVTALAHGCRALIPVADPSEARQRAATLDGGEPLLVGERRGETIPGFDLGNSPVEMAEARLRGRTVLLTTSNGTRALLAARSAAAIGIAALVNRTAAARWAGAQGHAVVLACAGERGGVSLEDHVCAGLLVEALAATRVTVDLSATAKAAAAVGRSYGTDIGRLREDSPWARHLVRRGRGADVDICLSLDTATLVPVYHPGVDEIVAGRG